MGRKMESKRRNCVIQWLGMVRSVVPIHVYLDIQTRDTISIFCTQLSVCQLWNVNVGQLRFMFT